MERPDVAVVTGGASGIGFALASAFGVQGKRIVLADLDPTTLDAARERLVSQGIDAYSHAVDVRDRGAVERLADRACELGKLAAVCCNAGVSYSGTNTWETADTTFDFVFDVNFRGLVHSFDAFVPPLLAQSTPATIVVTASMAGLVSSPASGAYSASKAAAIALTKALRDELAAMAPHVGVVLLNPGMVKTNLQRTSGAQQPGTLSTEFVEMSHEALNEYGVEPEEATRWVLDAIESGQFWALPPADDPFSAALAAELADLGNAIR